MVLIISAVLTAGLVLLMIYGISLGISKNGGNIKDPAAKFFILLVLSLSFANHFYNFRLLRVVTTEQTINSAFSIALLVVHILVTLSWIGLIGLLIWDTLFYSNRVKDEVGIIVIAVLSLTSLAVTGVWVAVGQIKLLNWLKRHKNTMLHSDIEQIGNPRQNR